MEVVPDKPNRVRSPEEQAALERYERQRIEQIRRGDVDREHLLTPDDIRALADEYARRRRR